MTLNPTDDGPPAAVRVWHAVSSSGFPGPLEQCCESWLTLSERQRADQFRQPTSRNQHVVGRGMARRLLSGAGVSPQSICFGIENHGKPYVTQPPPACLPFNVAHTDGLVMCGVGDRRHRLVGVDVERLGRRTDPALASRYFSTPEVQYLQRQPGEASRRFAFLKIWTLKEAFIKAIGTGLQTPLADFAFAEIDSETPTIRMLNPENLKLQSELAWRFFSHQPRDGFIAAVAVATSDPQQPVGLQMQAFEEWLTGPGH